MAEGMRLSLTEYSNKYGVSVSTLRRRIKAGHVDYVLDDGKYKLLNATLIEHKSIVRGKSTPQPMSLAPPQKKQGHRSEVDDLIVNQGMEKPEPSLSLNDSIEGLGQTDNSMFSTAREILGELKKAYALILQEKEEQILLLKEEMTDLKTLVSVLEEENSRLKSQRAELPEINDWLDSLDVRG